MNSAQYFMTFIAYHLFLFSMRLKENYFKRSIQIIENRYQIHWPIDNNRNVLTFLFINNYVKGFYLIQGALDSVNSLFSFFFFEKGDRNYFERVSFWNC